MQAPINPKFTINTPHYLHFYDIFHNPSILCSLSNISIFITSMLQYLKSICYFVWHSLYNMFQYIIFMLFWFSFMGILHLNDVISDSASISVQSMMIVDIIIKTTFLFKQYQVNYILLLLQQHYIFIFIQNIGMERTINIVMTPKNKQNTHKLLCTQNVIAQQLSHTIQNHQNMFSVQKMVIKSQKQTRKCINSQNSSQSKFIHHKNSINAQEKHKKQFLSLNPNNLQNVSQMEGNAANILAEISQNQKSIIKNRRLSLSSRTQNHLSYINSHSSNKKLRKSYHRKYQQNTQNIIDRCSPYQSPYSNNYQSSSVNKCQKVTISEFQPWQSNQFDEITTTKNLYYRNAFIIKHFDRSGPTRKTDNNHQNINERLLHPIKNFRKTDEFSTKKSVKKKSSRLLINSNTIQGQKVGDKQVDNKKIEPLRSMNTNQMDKKSGQKQNRKNKVSVQKRETLVPRKISVQQSHNDAELWDLSQLNNLDNNFNNFLPIKNKMNKKQKQNQNVIIKGRVNRMQNKIYESNKQKKLGNNTVYQMSQQAQKLQQEGINYMQFWMKHRSEQGCIQELINKLHKQKKKTIKQQQCDQNMQPIIKTINKANKEQHKNQTKYKDLKNKIKIV